MVKSYDIEDKDFDSNYEDSIDSMQHSLQNNEKNTNINIDESLLIGSEYYGGCDAPTFKPRSMYEAFFRRNTLAIKQYEAEQKKSGGTSLKRVLQWYHLVGYGFASTIGAGIFVVAGQVAQSTAGPATIFCFLVAAFSSLLSAFCYSEYAVRVPLSGSAYTFSYVTLGELIGWFIGWNLTLEYAISASAIARSWAGYLGELWDQLFPTHPMWDWLYNWIPFESFPNFVLSPLSMVVIIICTCVLIVGVQESAWINLGMTVFNIILILFIIIYGSFFVNVANWDPFFPFGVEGVFRGAGIVFFSFVGFDAVTTLAGEVSNPKRDLPVGIVGTLTFVTLLYCAVSMVLTGMVPYEDISTDAGLSAAFEYVDETWASILVGFGSVTTLSATTFASLLGQPRIFYQMAQDGLFFSAFGKLSAKGVPALGTVISSAFALFFAFFFDVGELTDMISIGTLMAFTVVCAGVVVMRHQNPKRPSQVPLMMLCYIIVCTLSAVSIFYEFPIWSWFFYALGPLIMIPSFFIFPVVDIPNGFKTPLVPFVPCIGIYINILLIISLDIWSLIRVLLWTVVGMIIYFGYGIRYSKQGAYERLLDTRNFNADL